MEIWFGRLLRIFEQRRLELRKVDLSGLMRVICGFANLLGEQKLLRLLLMTPWCWTRMECLNQIENYKYDHNQANMTL